MQDSSFYPVIPAGGSGKRLWPLSRRGEPKFLMPAHNGESNLLMQTLDRLKLVAPTDNVYVVTGESYAERILNEAREVSATNLLAEPGPMDSGPAIALAAAVIAKRHPNSVMGSFAADHAISDPDAFALAVRTAIAGAQRGYLMTIGVEPTRPDTGYGYIHFDASVDDDGIFSVRRFKEKPDLALATKFLETGEYLWNASMFVWRPEVFLEELRLEDPAMHDGVQRIASAWDGPHRAEILAATWPTLTRMAVEYLVMEPAAARGRIGTARGRFPWTDVGDFNTLGALHQPDADGNTIIAADRAPVAVLQGVGSISREASSDVLIRDSANTVIHPADGKLVVLIGVENLAIIDTEDVLLVCVRNRVQEVKTIADALPAIPREDLL